MTETPATPPASVPVFLQLALRRRNNAQSLSAIAAVGDDLDARGSTIALLLLKYRKLSSASGTLQGLLPSATNPVDFDAVNLGIFSAQSEMLLCSAKVDALEANQPFNTVTPQDEAALLVAIQAVDAATANTQALGALIGAIDQLVKAFAAGNV